MGGYLISGTPCLRARPRFWPGWESAGLITGANKLLSDFYIHHRGSQHITVGFTLHQLTKLETTTIKQLTKSDKCSMPRMNDTWLVAKFQDQALRVDKIGDLQSYTPCPGK